MLVSLFVGAADVDLLSASRDPQAALVLMQSRLPRTLAVVLSGASLALAGVVVQALVRNRFVGPDTTGTAEGAALGLLAVTLLAPGAPIWARMLAASVTALAATALLLAIIRRLPAREVMLVPITGLVLSGILGAGVSFVAWQADLIQQMGIWLGSGEFSGVVAGRYELLWIAGAAAVLAWFSADRFAILALGNDVAAGLGLDTGAVMRQGLLVVALVTATVVATVGMVPFVGLVVPNITARIMGDNLRASLPVVATGGAGLLLACDLAARLVVRPYELPVGLILGVIGSAVFLVLLHARPASG
ncbi:ABC transporter permease [Paracoccus contaminans]|uniref:Iron ABC transporter permease n=1 Tax=Paracoccus contaminans TaxID=1945662 RepID=A0A1W6D0N2_9RHOB|nr:iron chelate uptake ABC transporter family permease subunit [Paracoccus contaminans]ARJ70658.1 iron ABC transporter permease [Paracoccus contaminans]